MKVLLRCCLLSILLAPFCAAAQTVVVLGDSLSAGYGLRDGESWVVLLNTKLKRLSPEHQVVNASISGDTTANGLTRLAPVLSRHKPDVVVIELGGNDGLRGTPLGVIEKNLGALITRSQTAGAKVVLAGMRILPNYGPRYTEGFHGLYATLARRHNATLVPFLLDGIGGRSELMQADGIHPKAEAQATILDNLWPHLEPLLSHQ